MEQKDETNVFLKKKKTKSKKWMQFFNCKKKKKFLYQNKTKTQHRLFKVFMAI